jgi:hypothetical protein
MKHFLSPLVAISFVVAASVSAVDESRPTRVGYYQEVKVPAQYSVKRVKIKDEYRQNIKRTNGRIDLMEFPAVYREDKTKVAEVHTVMREIVCS